MIEIYKKKEGTTVKDNFYQGGLGNRILDRYPVS